jgi:hypothetical protein
LDAAEIIVRPMALAHYPYEDVQIPPLGRTRSCPAGANTPRSGNALMAFSSPPGLICEADNCRTLGPETCWAGARGRRVYGLRRAPVLAKRRRRVKRLLLFDDDISRF